MEMEERGILYMLNIHVDVERFQIEDSWELSVPVSHSPMSDT